MKAIFLRAGALLRPKLKKLVMGGRGLERYSFSTGFPSRHSVGIWENLFKSFPKSARAFLRHSKYIRFALYFMGGRGILSLTDSVQVSHFLAFRKAQKYGRTFSSPLAQSK
ncbi:MAG: hypothetical protein A2849_00170 [Candidatus Taylorbacteria bacterium RIFCSPHIGHO2_01_FULL_51_15]|uniref:Uncharacterized protein n=1 Tax=Candidatus Taylorbacteria bacterium RIFCSPHIGHO2_01_FULL_51_15 TaxID=1802304 RepID=A0A1G2MC11_9BACT|nr:MAG: hypothetical protein A2849_00170 [Candidatus Taylorbacteria bacterium RIFCSPHIGHO2_01_FULL_51_15]